MGILSKEELESLSSDESDTDIEEGDFIDVCSHDNEDILFKMDNNAVIDDTLNFATFEVGEIGDEEFTDIFNENESERSQTSAENNVPCEKNDDFDDCEWSSVNIEPGFPALKKRQEAEMEGSNGQVDHNFSSDDHKNNNKLLLKKDIKGYHSEEMHIEKFYDRNKCRSETKNEGIASIDNCFGSKKKPRRKRRNERRSDTKHMQEQHADKTRPNVIDKKVKDERVESYMSRKSCENYSHFRRIKNSDTSYKYNEKRRKRRKKTYKIWSHCKRYEDTRNNKTYESRTHHKLKDDTEMPRRKDEASSAEEYAHIIVDKMCNPSNNHRSNDTRLMEKITGRTIDPNYSKCHPCHDNSYNQNEGSTRIHKMASPSYPISTCYTPSSQSVHLESPTPKNSDNGTVVKEHIVWSELKKDPNKKVDNDVITYSNDDNDDVNTESRTNLLTSLPSHMKYPEREVESKNDPRNFKTSIFPPKSIDLKEMNTNKVVKYAAVTGIPQKDKSTEEAAASTCLPYIPSQSECKTINPVKVVQPTPTPNSIINSNATNQTCQEKSPIESWSLPWDKPTTGNVMSGLFGTIPRPNLMHPSYTFIPPWLIPAEKVNCYGLGYENGIMSNHVIRETVDHFEPLTIIPTESRYHISAACHMAVEQTRFTIPKSIDLPLSCVQDIYQCFPQHVIDKCSPFDPRIRKCIIIKSEPYINKTKTDNSITRPKNIDLVSTIIQSAKLSVNQATERNDIQCSLEKQTDAVPSKEKTFLSTERCASFAKPLEQLRKFGSLKSKQENSFSNIGHNVNKSAIVSILEGFSDIEPSLSPVMSDSEIDCDEDGNADFDNDCSNEDDVGDDKEYNISKDCNTENHRAYTQTNLEAKTKTGPITESSIKNEFVDKYSYISKSQHKSVKGKNVINATDTAPYQRVYRFTTGLDFTFNNPYGNAESDPRTIRDGSVSVTSEDDDIPMQDEMSSPVLLNACDRVYHIRRDSDTEYTPNLVCNTQPCNSWYSHKDVERLRAACHSSSRRVRNSRNKNYDLLEQVMHNAGINDHTIDTLLNSNSAVDNTFCEEDLYTNLFVEASESSDMAATTSINSSTVSDSCLPSTSSYIENQFSAYPTDNEVSSLLLDNSGLLDIYFHELETMSKSESQSVLYEQAQKPTTESFTIQNIRKESDTLSEECHNCQATSSNVCQGLCGQNNQRPSPDKLATSSPSLTINWETLDFLEKLVDESNVTTWQKTIPALTLNDEDKIICEKPGDKQDKTSTYNKSGMASGEMSGSSSGVPHLQQNETEYDFNIGGVIFPGSSRERRAKRQRTLAEVKHFNEKYVVPRIVVDITPQTPLSDICSEEKDKKFTTGWDYKNTITPQTPPKYVCSVETEKKPTTKLNVRKKRTRRKRKAHSKSSKATKNKGKYVNDDPDTDYSPVSKNTRLRLRSLIQSKQADNTSKQGNNREDKPMSSDFLEEGTVTSIAPKTRRRGRPKSKVSAVDNGEEVHNTFNKKGSLGSRTSTTFTAHVFQATIRPAVVIDGYPKPHKYRLIPRTKRHRHCYVFRTRRDNGGSQGMQSGQRLKQHTCRNNNADNDRFEKPSQTSSALLLEADMREFKKKLRQKDKDLDRYYSRCQKRPETSSFVQSMINTSSMKKWLAAKKDLQKENNGSFVPTSPVNEERKLNLNLEIDSSTNKDLFMPSKPDLQPCVLRFVQRMMGGYGDYFSESTDSQSREKRLQMCNLYLKRHGIRASSLPVLLQRRSDEQIRKTELKVDGKTTIPTDSKQTPKSPETKSIKSYANEPQNSVTTVSHLEKHLVNPRSSRTQTPFDQCQGEISGKIDNIHISPNSEKYKALKDSSQSYQPLSKQSPSNEIEAEKIPGGIINVFDDTHDSDNVCCSKQAKRNTPTLSLSENNISLPHNPIADEVVEVEHSFEDNTNVSVILSTRKDQSPTISNIQNGKNINLAAFSNDENNASVEFSSSKENIANNIPKEVYAGIKESTMDYFPTKFKEIDFEDPKSATSLVSDFEAPNKSRSEIEDEFLLSSILHDTDVSDMLEEVKTRVEDSSKFSSVISRNENCEFVDQTEKEKGGCHFDIHELTEDKILETNMMRMINYDSKGDAVLFGKTTKDEGGSNKDDKKYVKKTKSCGERSTNSVDETIPLTSLDEIAKDAENDFNSTIAGSLLRLETASEGFGNDVNIKPSFQEHYKRLEARSVIPKRSSLMLWRQRSNNLGTIVEEGDDDDDYVGKHEMYKTNGNNEVDIDNVKPLGD